MARPSGATSPPAQQLRGALPALPAVSSLSPPQSTSAFAFATISPSGSMLPGLGLRACSGSDDDKHRALLERRRKQRDLKRKSRARKKVRPLCVCVYCSG